MEVKCPKCQTVYHLEDSHIAPEGVNVQCTTCHNIFRVLPPQSDVSRAQTGWHLKKPDGTIINFAHLGELQKLILEYKANLEDMISKDGQTYKRLADMPEFGPLFMKRSQQKPQQEGAAVVDKKAEIPQPSTPPVQAVVTPISVPEEDIDIYGRPRKRGKAGVFIAVGVGVILIAIILAFIFKDRIFGARLTEQEMADLRAAEEEIQKTDYVSLENAYNLLEKYNRDVKEPVKLEILATLTHSLLLRGELLKLENSVVERRIREILKVDKFSEVAKKLNEGFNERQRLIQDLSNQTMTLLKKLDSMYGTRTLGKYMALEYIRIQAVFDKGSAAKGFEILNELKREKDFKYASRLKFIEGDLLLKTDEAKAEEGLKLISEYIAQEQTQILPHLMLVRYFVSKGNYEKALSEVDSVLNINPASSVAKSLKEHIEDMNNISRTGQIQAPQAQKEEPQKEEEKKGGVLKSEEKTPPKEEAKKEEGKKEEKETGQKAQEAKEKREERMAAPKGEKMVAAEPKSGGNYAQLIKQGRQFAAKGQIDKAVEVLTRASELEPTLAEPFLIMGNMYIDAGKNDLAVSAFSRAIKLKGNKCDAYMGLGEAYKYMKKNSEAKKYYQMYLEQCPNGPDAPVAKNNLNILK